MMARQRGLLLGVMVLAAVLPAPATADRIELRGGGEIRGMIVPGPAKPGEVLVQTETGSKPMAFAQARILRVTAERDALDDYFARRDKVAATAQAEYDFGLWCEEKRLSGLAYVHYQRAVDLDKGFAPAQKKLGHVLYNGVWLTYDQMREAQGMIKVKGRWVSRQERDRLETKATEKAEQTSWGRRIAILRRNLVNGTNEERLDAELRLAEIRDSAAVAPLVRALAGEEPAIRVKLARLLGAIPGAEARSALIDRVMAESEPVVRRAALDELDRRKEPETAVGFLRLLQGRDPELIGRAAWALAGLNVVSAVPKLIPHLVRVERRTVAVPVPPALSASAVGGPVMGPGPVVGSPAAGGVGSGNFAVGYSVPYLTGPVMGPGVVAFGATSVPFGTGSYVGDGFGYPAGGVATSGGGTVPRMVADRHPNRDVLEALVSLTGRDFGFDQTAWRRWLATSYRAEEPPARRVPQP